MNVDVSPDGQRIVFDLLGDIYTMPIDGSGASPATRLTAARRSTCSRASAPTASASPSPATATASGTSGRSTRTARTAKQISRERRWFVNSPTGRPTASTSTRAVTSSRSDRSAPARSGCITSAARRRPAGHRARTARRRTTASPTSRPTAATSITARTSRPGAIFEYNKDPNGTIYAIMRRDLTTGRERRAVSVPGRIGDAAGRRPTARRWPTSAACGWQSQLYLARSRQPARSTALRQASTRICRKRGRSTASIRSTRGRPTATRS